MSEVVPCEPLDRIVGGLTAFVMDFDGPATAHIGGTEYVTLYSHGIKPKGQEPMNFGWQEAIELYGDHLRAMIAENKGRQLAWRLRPQLLCRGDAAYHVYSRLAFI